MVPLRPPGPDVPAQRGDAGAAGRPRRLRDRARQTPEGRLKKALIRIGQLALTVLVTWFILDRLGPGLDELRGADPALWRPDVPLALAASLLLLAAYFWSAALWGRIVVDLGGPRLQPLDATRLFMIANLGRYLPGKVWQIAGLAVMARGRGVPAATATAAAVLGQGVALVAATLIGMGAVLAGPPELRRHGLAAAALLGLAVAVGLTPRVFDRLVAFWFRLARQEPPGHLGSGHAVMWLLLFVANWALYAFSFWVLAASFGHTAHLVPVASSFAAAYVLGYAMIFAPAGVGVREGFLVAFLTPYLGGPEATVLAIGARVWTTLVELVPAGAFWLRHVIVGGSEPNTTEERR